MADRRGRNAASPSGPINAPARLVGRAAAVRGDSPRPYGVRGPGRCLGGAGPRAQPGWQWADDGVCGRGAAEGQVLFNDAARQIVTLTADRAVCVCE